MRFIKKKNTQASISIYTSTAAELFHIRVTIERTPIPSATTSKHKNYSFYVNILIKVKFKSCEEVIYLIYDIYPFQQQILNSKRCYTMLTPGFELFDMRIY